MRLLLLELAGEYDKIYDPATGEYGVDVVEIPGSAILASASRKTAPLRISAKSPARPTAT